jgi:predicted flap endonuclease-1-like 5' DNA nuclease
MVTGWLWWFVLGALIGWLVEWLIDWFYWRQRIEAYTTEIETLRAQSGSWKAERDQAVAASQRCASDLDALRRSHATLTSGRDGLQAELATLRADHGALLAERDGLRAEIEALRAEMDGLRAKTGALRAAAAPPAVGDQSRLALAPDFERQLNVAKESRAKIAAERDALESEVVTLRARLAGGANMSGVNALAVGIYGGVAGNELPQRDRLIDIIGIGPVFERRLNKAGISTFAQLASTSSARIHEIIEPEEWQAIDAEAWIAEAREFVERRAGRTNQGDRLIDILGIGPVYERRLNEAGILTFAQLYSLTPEQIRAIIKPESWQNIDPESWIAQARTMDAAQRKEAGA